MKHVSLKQSIPFHQKILVGLTLLSIGVVSFKENNIVSGLLFFLGIFIFSLGYSLVINQSFGAYYQFKSFGISIFRINKKLEFPDYISLFNQAFTDSNNVGFSPNILGSSNYKLFTIKLFTENRHTILFTSADKGETEKLGIALGNMLKVKLHNTL